MPPELQMAAIECLLKTILRQGGCGMGQWFPPKTDGLQCRAGSPHWHGAAARHVKGVDLRLLL